MGAPVFKIGERLRRAGAGGFDSHALPRGLTERSISDPIDVYEREPVFSRFVDPLIGT